MAYSYVDYTGNGSSTTYSVPFSYISQSHVKVYLNSVLQSSGYTWNTSSSIQFTVAPANGVAIRISRSSSPSSPLVVYQDGSTLTQTQLQTANNQSFYLAQEALDTTTTNLSQNNSGVFDALNKRITNVVDPTSAQDAATKAYVDSNISTGAANAASAAASASSAAASYDSFDDRYLGAKASDPTVDNDGNALLTGALYWSTSLNAMRSYNGSAWQSVTNVANSYSQTFSGNGSTTAFTLTVSPASAANLHVFISGVRQTPTTDYTVSGTTLTFTAAPPSGTSNVLAVWVEAVPAVSDSALTGNLTFTGTGNRITGDFSNATIANRVMFQTSTANSQSSIGALPNGTATQSGFIAYNGSDPANAAYITAICNASETSFRASFSGTASYLPMTFYTGGSERMRIDTSGNVGVGTSPSYKFHLNKGSAGVLADFTDGVNTNFRVETSGFSCTVGPTAGSTNLALRANNVTALSLDATGNTLHINANGGLGYGTGAGGTVTQATSKSTAVTLNKPTGKITMNNASLAANTAVFFPLNNSLITANDTLILGFDNNTIASPDQYVLSYSVQAGVAYISLRNMTAGALAVAVGINFAIIKGATS